MGLGTWLNGDHTMYNGDQHGQSGSAMQDSGEWRNLLGQQWAGAQGRNPLAGVQGQQQGLYQQLLGVSNGQTPGAGELAVNRQVGAGMAGLQSNAVSQRGNNAALAARAAMRGAADLGVAGAGQAQMAAMNDQTNARGLMSSLLGQQQQGQLAQAGMNDQYALGTFGQVAGMNQAEMAARLQQAQLMGGQRQQGMLGQLLQAGGTIGAGYLGRPSGGGGGQTLGAGQSVYPGGY